jgi:hypothetical protein
MPNTVKGKALQIETPFFNDRPRLRLRGVFPDSAFGSRSGKICAGADDFMGE